MDATSRPAAVAGSGRTGRGRWHRRAGMIPLGYLVLIVVVAFTHPLLPQWRWLLVHLLLLGAVTNAIVVWSTHFAIAVLRAPAPANRRGEAVRLATLNAGIVGVLAGGSGEGGWRWVAVAGSVAVFAAVLAHLIVLAMRLRRALPAPFVVTVHYYLAAATALLAGIPAGAVMLVSGHSPRVLLFHVHVNVLGWVTLTVLGTVLTLWPTVLRTRMASGAVRAANIALPMAVAGLVALSVGVLAWWPLLAAAGVAVFFAAVEPRGSSALRPAARRCVRAVAPPHGEPAVAPDGRARRGTVWWRASTVSTGSAGAVNHRGRRVAHPLKPVTDKRCQCRRPR